MDIITLALAKKYANKKVSELADIGVSYKIVETLPTIGEEGVLYLVKNLMDPSENNLYNEYMYIENTWEYVGKTGVDLSEYATKNEVFPFLDARINQINLNDYTEVGSCYFIIGHKVLNVPNSNSLAFSWADGYILTIGNGIKGDGDNSVITQTLTPLPTYVPNGGASFSHTIVSYRTYNVSTQKFGNWTSKKLFTGNYENMITEGSEIALSQYGAYKMYGELKKYADNAAAGAGSLPIIMATDETNPVNLSDYAENGTAYIVKGHFFIPDTRNSMLGEWADWFLLINADAPNGDVYQTLRPFSTVFLNGDYVLNSKIAFKLASEDEWKTTDIFTGEYDDPTALGGFSPAGAYMMYNDITGQMNTYVINPSDEAYTTFFTEGEEEFNFINEEIGNDFAIQLAGVLQTIYDKYTSNEYGILLYLDNQPVWFKATDLWDEPESLTLANTYIYNGENGPIIKEVGLFVTLVWEDGYITQIGIGTGHNYIKVASEDLLDEKLGDIDTILTHIVDSTLVADEKEY